MSERRIVVFDVETTGTDSKTDQVIELCVQFGVAIDAPSRTWRIKPSVTISPGAQQVHGISANDLANCPSFAEVADEIRHIFEEAEVLVGYNLSFDIDMLQAEFARLKQPLIEFSRKHIVDPFRLWQQCEPRSLQDAHRRFVGQDFAAAHSAAADVAATGRVLRGMVAAFGLTPSWSDVAKVCEPDRVRWVGPSRHLQWSDEGRIVLGFGKHKGIAIAELSASDDLRGYAQWIANKDFPVHVGQILGRALESDEADMLKWVIETFGPPDLSDTVSHSSSGIPRSNPGASSPNPSVSGSEAGGDATLAAP